jgi:hypothetical protein
MADLRFSQVMEEGSGFQYRTGNKEIKVDLS